MYKQILEHDKYVNNKINDENTDLKNLLAYHNQQIGYIQHERLIHLIITLYTGIFFLISGVIMLLVQHVITSILFLTLMIVSIFYLIHYCKLENMTQKWYGYSTIIYKKIINRTSSKL